MTKSCCQCKTSFEITNQDLKFYERVSPIIGGKKYFVPSPTLCPDCRKQRRLTWRNERTLYSRSCDKCHKIMISLYSPDKSYPVYCHDCWWDEEFDALQYGRDIDFSRSFFSQYAELQRVVPRLTLLNTEHENAEYANHAGNNKNCYLIFASFNTENVYYSRMVKYSKDCMDCSTLINHCELCYECIQCDNCYRTYYCRYCVQCTDSFFLLDCRNCVECFCCVGLRNKQHCWFNEQLSPQEFRRRLSNIKRGSYAEIEKFKHTFTTHALQYPRPYAFLMSCEDCTGDDLISCKRCYASFDMQNARDCKFYETGSGISDCYDAFGVGGVFGEAIEWLYEVHGVAGSQNLFCHMCYRYDRMLYCDLCMNSESSFGCIGLKSNKYCIFNRQYSKQEYEKLIPKIIDYMKRTEEWGEFFPARLSPYGYNETVAQEYYPVLKAEANKQGLTWSEYEAPLSKASKVVRARELPDLISDISDEILDQTIKCEVTQKLFRIIPEELAFYRKHQIPLPRRHPDQRHKDRVALRNPRKLWSRQCMCEETTHDHHKGETCLTVFQTTYAPDRPEKVYCEACYLKEVY